MTSNPTPRTVLKRNENICPYRNLYTNVYSGTIHNRQMMEKLKCLEKDDWVNELWHIHAIEYYKEMK